MVGSARETIKLGTKPSRLTVEAVSNDRSLTAMGATHYWALRCKAANGSGKMSADNYVVEVWRVER
jgi:hypothetical protein